MVYLVLMLTLNFECHKIRHYIGDFLSAKQGFIVLRHQVGQILFHHVFVGIDNAMVEIERNTLSRAMIGGMIR